MLEVEFLLEDRISKIKSINDNYNLLDNSVISFSGGKDSTLLHYLIDLALPNNNIPRVFINTGIEYNFIVQFVKELAFLDDRFIIINNKNNIKSTLNVYGFPFKSKEHSKKVAQYQKSGVLTDYLKKYLVEPSVSRYHCPKVLRYQFTPLNKLKVSNLCCDKLKKDNFNSYLKYTDKNIVITGMRRDEGGQRTTLNCISFNKYLHFNPLVVIDNKQEDDLIKYLDIKLCKLYYPPYNFERTGCKGCPYNIYLQEELYKMKDLLPNEYKQCQIIWKPVYDEYRRLNYRLNKQLNIFDFI